MWRDLARFGAILARFWRDCIYILLMLLRFLINMTNIQLVRRLYLIGRAGLISILFGAIMVARQLLRVK